MTAHPQTTPPNLLAQAMESQHSRRFDEAERLYRRILALKPNDVDALQLLGYLMLQTDRPAAAIPLYERAHRLSPQPAFRLYLGEALYLTNRPAEALGLFDEAAPTFPANSELFFFRGLALRALGRTADSLHSLRQSVACNPDDRANVDFLAKILLTTGRHEEGVEVFRELLQDFPASAPLRYALGASLCCLGREEEAEPELTEAIRLGCEVAEAFDLLGRCARKAGRLPDAIRYFHDAVRRKPDFVSAMNNLGLSLSDLEHFNQAVAIQCAALKLDPDYVASNNNLASCLLRQGKITDSLKFHRRCTELSPSVAAFASNVLLSLNYDPQQTPESLFREHLSYQERLDKYSKLPAEPFAAVIPPPGARLRLGFASADFRGHSVAYWLEPLLAHLDRARCTVIAFDHQEGKGDKVTERLRGRCDEWVYTGAGDQAKALETIRAANVDILVDLSGHTARNLLPVFHRRAAAVQLSFLGYPNTTGLQNMDGRLSDPYADPAGATEPFHSERVYRFERSAWCYQPPPDSPAPARSARDHIVFGCFNNLAKIQPPLFERWAEILHRVPGSRFYLKSSGLQDPHLHQSFVKRFAALGITADRLLLEGRRPGVANHLARYHEVDVALDTFPYHGTTTTAESLWMGVPTIALAGPDHRSRVAVSLLTNVGHPEWIAQSWEEYVAIACALAADIPRLDEIRRTLRDEMLRSPLLDARGYADDFLRLCESALADRREHLRAGPPS